MDGLERLGAWIAAAADFLTQQPAVAVAATFLALIFAWSGASKVRRPEAAAAAIANFGSWRRAPAWAGTLLGVAELALAGILLTSTVLESLSAPAAGAATLALLVFVVVVTRAVRAHEDFECACFGATASRVSIATLVRTTALAVLAGAVLLWVLINGSFAGGGRSAVEGGVVASALLACGVLGARAWTLRRWNADPFRMDPSLRMAKIAPPLGKAGA